jgi:hypothetical protein
VPCVSALTTPGYLFGKLVISGLHKISGGCEIVWVEFRPYDESPARVCTGERCTLLYEPGSDDVLSAVDEAERLSRRPSEEGPIGYCQAPHENEGEHGWASF